MKKPKNETKTNAGRLSEEGDGGWGCEACNNDRRCDIDKKVAQRTAGDKAKKWEEIYI